MKMFAGPKFQALRVHHNGLKSEHAPCFMTTQKCSFHSGSENNYIFLMAPTKGSIITGTPALDVCHEMSRRGLGE